MGDVQVQSVLEEEITGNGAATLFAEGFTADVVISPEPTEQRARQCGCDKIPADGSWSAI